MKYSELTAELRAAGCYLLRHGSKHDVWVNSMTNERFLVPRHGSREVPKGTERIIRKAAGI